jgi:hypothetical protein
MRASTINGQHNPDEGIIIHALILYLWPTTPLEDESNQPNDFSASHHIYPLTVWLALPAGQGGQ